MKLFSLWEPAGRRTPNGRVRTEHDAHPRCASTSEEAKSVRPVQDSRKSASVTVGTLRKDKTFWMDADRLKYRVPPLSGEIRITPKRGIRVPCGGYREGIGTAWDMPYVACATGGEAALPRFRGNAFSSANAYNIIGPRSPARCVYGP